MGKIENVEVQNCMEWFTAAYVDGDRKKYEVMFAESRDENTGFEERELVNVEMDGKTVPYSESIWQEIQEQLDRSDGEDCNRIIRFVIQIERSWLETLDSLVEMVMSSPGLSPEDAIEVSVFSQFKTQRGEREICHV
jgi:hypothetical protein